MGTLTWRHLWLHLARFFTKREMFPIKDLEKIKTQFFFSQELFCFETHVVYEIMWKNTAQPDWPQMTIRRMRNACRISKATSKHSEYEILTAFPPQRWLCDRATMLHLYVRCLPFYNFFFWGGKTNENVLPYVKFSVLKLHLAHTSSIYFLILLYSCALTNVSNSTWTRTTRLKEWSYVTPILFHISEVVFASINRLLSGL